MKEKEKIEEILMKEFGKFEWVDDKTISNFEVYEGAKIIACEDFFVMLEKVKVDEEDIFYVTKDSSKICSEAIGYIKVM